MAIDDPSFLQTVEAWLESSRELFVELYYPRSGGGGDLYFVPSLQTFKQMLSDARPSAVFFVLRDRQYPIRGVVDDAFIQRALREVSNGESYEIVEPAMYPSRLSFCGESGCSSHEQYMKDLEEYRGKIVYTGKSANLPNSYWEQNNDENVIIGRKLPSESK